MRLTQVVKLLEGNGETMKKFNSQRGQSLVELAISLLVLLYLLSGAVEFGLAFFQFVQLRDAAQEGALFGSMGGPAGPDPALIETRVRGASSSPIDLAVTSGPKAVAVTITAKDKTSNAVIPVTGACEGDALEVKVKFDHTVFMPFMSQIIGATIPLTATVTDTVLSPIQTSASCAP
jgi:Flp pilus assembly protein TadG